MDVVTLGQARAQGDRRYPVVGLRPFYLALYERFFPAGYTFLPASTPNTLVTTTTTALVASGQTVIPVTDGTLFLDGIVIVLKAGTAQQTLHKVASGGGTNSLTITPALTSSLPNGSTFAALWIHPVHPSPEGIKAIAYWMMDQRRADNTRVIQDPGTTRPVTFLFNSWGSVAVAGSPNKWATAVQAVYPGAQVTMAAVSGNNSSDLLARFDTDVPSNSAYVVIDEPGVNDAQQAISPLVQRANLEALVAKIRAIGATPVILGTCPISTDLAVSAAQTALLAALFATPTQFPATGSAALDVVRKQSAPWSESTSYGVDALSKDLSGRSTAFGRSASKANTTAINTFLGDESGLVATTNSCNTGLGTSTLRVLNSGVNNTAAGHEAGAGVTAGSNNVFMGYQTGFKGNGVTANVTNLGARQTFIGSRAGQNSATQRNDVVALGYVAVVDADDAIAIGSGANASHTGAISLGKAVATTAAQQLNIGARHIELTELAADPAAGATNAGRFYLKDNGSGKSQLAFRFATGAVQILLTEP